MKLLSLIMLSIAFMLGACGGGGEKELKPVFDDMKKAGCEANVQKFFSYVDQEALRTTFDKNVMDKVLGGAYDNMLSERSQELGADGIQKVADEYVSGVIRHYTEQVEKGKTGDICRMGIVGVKNYTVTVKMPGQPDIIWTFQKSDDGIKLVTVY